MYGCVQGVADNGNKSSTFPLVELQVEEQQVKEIANTTHQKSFISMNIFYS